MQFSKSSQKNSGIMNRSELQKIGTKYFPIDTTSKSKG
jgi:hypothetical protein